MLRYHVEMKDNRGNFKACALAEAYGEVVSNTPNFDGHNDLALIDIPEDDSDHFEDILEADDNVVAYRAYVHQD